MTQLDQKSDRHKTPARAARTHQGNGHWHVERRANVIICQNCEARIPTWMKPQFCPECEEGRAPNGE